MGGGGQHCSVLVARSNGVNSLLRETKGMNEAERKRRRKREKRGSREDGERGREPSRGVAKGAKGWPEEMEGGTQALAQPVMIDWFAGSQQTDVRPPDQPTHPPTPQLTPPPRVPSPSRNTLCQD